MLGAALTLASWLIFLAWPSLAGLVAGVVLLDFAMQSALVSNQHTVFALRPAARSRLNTILMGAMFLGGAGGSAAATAAWNAGGWVAVCATGMACGVGAVALQMTATRRRHHAIAARG